MLRTLALAATVSTVAFLAVPGPAQADEFTKEKLAKWQAAYDTVVAKGRAAFTDPTLGGSKNGVVCAQCHPNAANTHAETYPKFQQQLGRVAVLGEMINWCIRNPLEGNPLALDDPKMIALQAYITHERRGQKLAPGKH